MISALQRAVDYIEAHLDDRLPVPDVAKASFYSSPHLSWMFKDVTGISIGDYIRRRRISEAATSILKGTSIVEAALSYGFSSQQVFTRCFSSYFGVPPAAFRRHRRGLGKLIPKLSITEEGESMKLKPYYNWKNSDAVDELMERVLTDNALEVVARAVESPVEESDVDEKTAADLLYIRALRREGERLAINVPVILRGDSARMDQAARFFGDTLVAEITDTIDPTSLDEHPRVHNEYDRKRMSHFLASAVTLGWQGHEMLSRLGRIPGREENTDDKGRWFLLRFFEPTEEEYVGRRTGGGGTWCGTKWSLSTKAATREQNILGHFAGVCGSTGEDEYTLRLIMTEILVDGLAEYAKGGQEPPAYRVLAEKLSLTVNDHTEALILSADEFDVARTYIRGIYDAMVRWWEANESAVDEVLDELTPRRHGIAHRHLYHWAWGFIVGYTQETLFDRGFLVDVSELPNGAINVFWENELNLQSNCISD